MQLLTLKNNKVRYDMGINKTGHLIHLYYGDPIEELPEEYIESHMDEINPDSQLHEMSAFGLGDYRSPSYQIRLDNGTVVTDFIYKSHRYIEEKPGLEGLPSLYLNDNSEGKTLEVELEDSYSGVIMKLSYTLFTNIPVIARHVKVVNKGSMKVHCEKLLSGIVDLPRADYDVIQLSGGWSREKKPYRRPIMPGKIHLDSKRGLSSHAQTPMLTLVEKHTTETNGRAYGFNLVYSGNFVTEVEVDAFDRTRIMMGINDFHFNWNLEPGSSLTSPEWVMVYSNEGIGQMSRTFHDLYRKNLLRGKFKEELRPILVNNWEATYFNFNHDKIMAIAREAKDMGIEMMVLDDGWFGHRDSDNSSLGDWFVDKRKLPDGITKLADDIHGLGLKFGLWFEPEMISRDSELYKKHPEWAIHVPHREPGDHPFQRWQMVLDMTNTEVRDYLVRVVGDMLIEGKVDYVKWDMNRSQSDIGSQTLAPEAQGEFFHRYILGLYDLLERITSQHPDVLFESCASGGGRFDPGMLYYMPQTWTSDDTDAIERLTIQEGTSMAYPAISMGAHVSCSPNHQVGRVTSLEVRGHVAMAGNYGYEVDLTKFTPEEKALAIKQVSFYKSVRELVQKGDQYRLLSYTAGGCGAWMYVSKDGSKALVTHVRSLAKPYAPYGRLLLGGLESDAMYEITLMENQEPGQSFKAFGEFLMVLGLEVTNKFGDFLSQQWTITKL